MHASVHCGLVRENSRSPGAEPNRPAVPCLRCEEASGGRNSNSLAAGPRTAARMAKLRGFCVRQISPNCRNFESMSSFSFQPPPIWRSAVGFHSSQSGNHPLVTVGPLCPDARRNTVSGTLSSGKPHSLRLGEAFLSTVIERRKVGSDRNLGGAL